METKEFCLHKVINSVTKELEVDIYGKSPFWGWLGSRRITKNDWEMIGKEMGWK